MKNGKVLLVVISLLCSAFISIGGINVVAVSEIDENVGENFDIYEEQQFVNSEPFIEIVTPASGYMYLFKLDPIRLPIVSILNLGFSVVVDRSLVIDTNSEDIDHVKFVAKGRVTGWETVRWDYQSIDGLSTDELGLSSGLYDIDVIAYDEFENELCSDSSKVLFIKVGRDDFGLRINTRYNGGEEISIPLDIGISEFASMLNTGESKFIDVPIQNQDDTTVELRFTRTKILDGTENVIETKFNIETDCDTTKDYEVSLEARFPFIMLDGGQP